MAESAKTYQPQFLQERRRAKERHLFRRSMGIFAVAAALTIGASADGGARSSVRDVINFARDRIEMVKAAFDPSPAQQANQTQHYLQAHPDQARIEQHLQQTSTQNAAEMARRDQ